jgi:hypothetical protein
MASMSLESTKALRRVSQRRSQATMSYHDASGGDHHSHASDAGDAAFLALMLMNANDSEGRRRSGRSGQVASIYVTDINRDGWPDLYMSGLPIGSENTAGISDLYVNCGGHFHRTHVATDAGAFSAPIRSEPGGRVDIVFLTYGPGAHAVPVLMRSSLP